MADVDVGRIATLAIGAGIVLWAVSAAAKKAASAAADAASNAFDAASNSAPVNMISAPIANAILAVTLPGRVQVNGNVRLPNGAVIPISGLRIDESGRFKYGTRFYKIIGTLGDGTRYTQEVDLLRI